MADVVDPATRSRMMSGIRGKDTQPELFLRRALHRRGFRYRLHDRRLPGKPDLVFPSRRAVIFVHGCFWHGHDCSLFRWPSSRPDFWRQKFARNREKDAESLALLNAEGWRALVLWECAIKGRFRLNAEGITDAVAAWLVCGAKNLELRGSDKDASGRLHRLDG